MDWSTTTAVLVNAVMLFPITGIVWLALDTYKSLISDSE